MNTVTIPATVSIGSVQIHQHGGLYSLNDLHQASGGEEKHQPAKFMRLDTTCALIAEISNSPDVANNNPNAGISAFKTTRGKYGGTYACRELVIAYAAWISAEFHLRVIRVFLDSVDTQRAHLPPPVPTKTLTFTVPVGEIGHRWLLHTDRQGSEIVTPLSPDTHIATPAELVNVLMKSPPDLNLTHEQQLTIVSACLRNLNQSAASSALRLGIKPAVPSRTSQGAFALFGRPATGASA